MQVETPSTEKPFDKPEGDRRGLVIVNTGKGKSTAAFGLVARAEKMSMAAFSLLSRCNCRLTACFRRAGARSQQGFSMTVFRRCKIGKTSRHEP